MIKITPAQVRKKIQFIEDYKKAENNAEGSKLDANANVSCKNISTLSAELNKDINIQVNRALMRDKIKELFGEETALEYIRQIAEHEIYVHDESSLMPYCASITLYPLLLDGLTKLGGECKAPKHIQSFCGSLINLVFAISSQFAGAVATVEFLMYFDHFARKDWGDDYLNTHKEIVEGLFQHVVYSINQPAASRNYQSCFWNISLYDREYFNSMFGNFVFPDGNKPVYESVDKLQRFFMKWFNKERERAVLTFPVITAAMLVDDKSPVDKDFADFCAEELSEGNSFFIYQSKSADSLASCCRLRNEMSDNTFSYTLGAGGVSTGSINVITINMNRLVQDNRDLKIEVEKVQKYQVAYRSLMDDYHKAGLLPAYDAGFIHLDKQFLTIGINGMVEAAESQGIQPGNNKKYKNWVKTQLRTIYNANKRAKNKYGYMFNTEFVPAENLGAKNAAWDKKGGYEVNRDLYNSYFYPVEDESINALDKFILHGEEIVQYLDGGSALHLNLDDYPTKESYLKLFDISARVGCNYFTTNVKVTVCNECDNIDKKTLHKCPKCGSDNVDWATRVIGYLKRVDSFSSARQQEEKLRHYHNKDIKTQ